MINHFRNGRWLIASAFIVASCSQGDTSRITSPSNVVTAASNGAGIVDGSAVGDVKTGTGALEIIRLRMYRLSPAGAIVVGQYALPGVTYGMSAGETIELWTEWDPDVKLVPTVIPANPNMTVDWGFGEGSTDINCGSCLLRHKYLKPGVYTVVVTLNDRNGTKVSRTFYLNSLEPLPTPNPGPGCIAPTATGGFPNICAPGTYNASVHFTGSGLTYGLVEGACPVTFIGNEVSAMGAPTRTISINETTGVISFDPAFFYCVQVTATNACGSAVQQLGIAIFSFCD